MNRKGKGKILDRRRPWLYSNKIGARVNGLQVEASEHGAGVIEKSLWGRSGIIICIWFASDYFGFAWEIKRERVPLVHAKSVSTCLSLSLPINRRWKTKRRAPRKSFLFLGLHANTHQQQSAPLMMMERDTRAACSICHRLIVQIS